MKRNTFLTILARGLSLGCFVIGGVSATIAAVTLLTASDNAAVMTPAITLEGLIAFGGFTFGSILYYAAKQRHLASANSSPIRVSWNFRVEIGEVVKTDIEAENIVVAGTVLGNLLARHRIDILASGTVIGDVTAHRVFVAEGATFKGKVDLRKPVV
ncbi:hypothetical protein U14_00184 [Candidatus Moduliflexus flocculans]|uniref:Polymer-forming cytoskeletal protein n=1 Tax=Candidatus Moduliflexus flocculans TaxID=1499966 RepID=A0A0S6VPU0_9BACT|nr:hypothetical protein U14_00184 [Candidatus Moduliflexus flocculans]